MGRVRICIGNYATTPYEMVQTGNRIYSLEELCYYLCTNAFLLDSEWITAQLIEWIEIQLGLSELAKELNAMLRNGNSLGSFVARILEAGHFCEPEEQNKVLKVIQENSKLNIYEKKKKRIDYLASSGCYEQALLEYQRLLPLVTGKDLALTGELYMAMGKAAARMFYFSMAEEMFEKAYKITYRRESMLYYICAVKMHGTKEEQVQKLASSLELKELETEADHILEQLRQQWQDSDSAKKLARMEQMWEDGKPAEYYELVERTADQLKEEYRLHTQS